MSGDHDFVRVPLPAAEQRASGEGGDWRCSRCGFVTISSVRPDRDGPGGILWIVRAGEQRQSPDVECDLAVVLGVMGS